jgi:hypothetical protein
MHVTQQPLVHRYGYAQARITGLQVSIQQQYLAVRSIYISDKSPVPLHEGLEGVLPDMPGQISGYIAAPQSLCIHSRLVPAI